MLISSTPAGPRTRPPTPAGSRSPRPSSDASCGSRTPPSRARLLRPPRASADRLEGGERPSGDRAGEEQVDERCPRREPRPEVVLDRDPAAAAGRLDPPGDVHPVRRAALVDEPDPAGLGLAPCPRPPRHRQAEAEQPEQRATSDHAGDHAAVGAAVRGSGRPRSGGAAAASAPRRGRARTRLPAAPRRRSRWRSSCERAGPHETDRVACDRHQLQAGHLVPPEPAAAVRRAVDLVGQPAAGHLDAVQDTEEVQVGAARVRRARVEVREDAFDLRDAAREPAFLAQLADDGVVGMLPEVDATAGQRPRPGLGLVRGQAAQQDPVLAVEADRIAPEARASAGRARAWAR